jgi:hypothetical protein
MPVAVKLLEEGSEGLVLVETTWHQLNLNFSVGSHSVVPVVPLLVLRMLLSFVIL